MNTWVERLWNSGTNSELVTAMREFATASSMKNPADKLVKSITKAVTFSDFLSLLFQIKEEESKRQVVWDKPPPAPLLPLCLALGKPFGKELLSFKTIHVKEIARQITLVEQNMFKAIKPWELIGLAWAKNKAMSPHVTALTQHFNNVPTFHLLLTQENSRLANGWCAKLFL